MYYVKTFVYTHIWLSCIAVFLTLECKQLFPDIHQSFYIFLFAGTSTLFAYNAHTLAVIHIKGVKNELGVWSIRHKWDIRIACIIGLVISLYIIYFQMSGNQVFILIGSALCWLLYEGYLITFSKRKQRLLKVFPFMKNGILAFVWLAITSLLPISANGFAWTTNSDYILLLIVRFFTFFLVTILFDYRDISSDRMLDVKTMPAKFGINTTAYIAYVIALFLLVSLPFLQVGTYFVIIKIIQISLLFFFLRTRNTTSFQASMLLWDGILILSPLTSLCI